MDALVIVSVEFKKLFSGPISGHFDESRGAALSGLPLASVKPIWPFIGLVY